MASALHSTGPHIYLEVQSDDWSDDNNAESPRVPEDLNAAIRRIKLLENTLAKSKQDLAEYQKFVAERLDIARLSEAISDAPSSAPAPRDDDTHYFESYGGNGAQNNWC